MMGRFSSDDRGVEKDGGPEEEWHSHAVRAWAQSMLHLIAATLRVAMLM